MILFFKFKKLFLLFLVFESDIRTVKNKSANWAAYCSYDGQIFYQRLDKRFSQSGSLTCRDSYTYSFDLKVKINNKF